MRIALISLLFALPGVLATATDARAQALDEGRLVVVQQRKYRLAQELVPSVPLEVQDAFSKGLGLDLAYVWHLDDTWAWQVARGGYLLRLDTGLRTQLERDFGVAPTQFEELQFYAGTALQWSPLYGKLAFHDTLIVHVEAFATLGLTVGRFTSSFAVGPELGFGLRVFLGNHVSLRFEARDAVLVNARVNNVVLLSTGVALTWGGTEG